MPGGLSHVVGVVVALRRVGTAEPASGLAAERQVAPRELVVQVMDRRRLDLGTEQGFQGVEERSGPHQQEELGDLGVREIAPTAETAG